MQLPLLRQVVGKDLRASLFSCLALAAPDAPLPAATDASLGEIITGGDGSTVMILLQNTGANPLATFHLGAVPTDDCPVAAGNVYPDMITTAQFHAGAPIANLLLAQSTDPTLLAAGAFALVVVKANAAYALQLRASSTAGTTVRVWASVSRQP